MNCSGCGRRLGSGKTKRVLRFSLVISVKFFRDKGYQSRPTQCHGIDLVTDKPHVVTEQVSAEKFEEVLKPGMVIMAEPNPITADGLFGIFLGHTFIVTDSGNEVVDDFPLEIAVAKT